MDIMVATTGKCFANGGPGETGFFFVTTINYTLVCDSTAALVGYNHRKTFFPLLLSDLGKMPWHFIFFWRNGFTSKYPSGAIENPQIYDVSYFHCNFETNISMEIWQLRQKMNF